MPCFGLAEGEANENNIDAICPCYLVVAEYFSFISLVLFLRSSFETKTWWQKC